MSVSGVFLWGLRYPGAHWAAVLTGAEGGIDFWRLVHRAGGLVFTFTCFYHQVYCIVHPEGRRDFIQMLPRAKDVADLTTPAKPWASNGGCRSGMRWKK